MLASSSPPDGLFCFSDELAIGALRALHEQGVRVPQDIRVVGFDDVDETRYCITSLTSVRPDTAAITERALVMLLERLDGNRSRPRDVRVGHELIARESSVSPH